MTASRLLWAVAVSLFALVIAMSLAVYPTMPAELPTGLDADGAPRGTTPKSLLAWLTAPLLLGGITALLGGLGAIVHRYPGLFSGGAPRGCCRRRCSWACCRAPWASASSCATSRTA
jgi:uncharacterized membrane protein